MSSVPSNVENFNTVVAHIFAQLYDHFPSQIDIDFSVIADAMKIEKEEVETFTSRKNYNYGDLPNGVNFYGFVNDTLSWLRQEGFIKSPGRDYVTECTLTREALVAMNKTPSGIQKGETLGSQITDAAKGASKAAGSAAIGDLVGQVIGGVTKSFLS